ncbi:MAG: RNA-guided endonuclease InsQ/TnpB family protein [Candidatus Heimdallarchaeota archaeon]
MRYRTLKGGLILPFLDFPWSGDHTGQKNLRAPRVLATDLGVINLTTSVICEAGSQISPPLFWSPPQSTLNKIDQLYHYVARLQRKLDLYRKEWAGQGKRFQERERLYRKLNRYREELLHLTSNQLIATALHWQCQTLVLEDLRNYDPPKSRRKLSRKLSNWLRGALYELLVYKAKRVGLTVRRVNPRWTSSYCPRCGVKGLKIREPRARQSAPQGRFFLCPHCHFIADRDYIASVNIYRIYQEQQQKRFRLKYATPVPYTATGSPLNCPSGASAHLSVGG